MDDIHKYDFGDLMEEPVSTYGEMQEIKENDVWEIRRRRLFGFIVTFHLHLL